MLAEKLYLERQNKMAVSTGPADRAVVRVINANSCGSGAVVGRNSTGSWVATNAHVAGTKVGRVVQCDAIVNGQTKRFAATVIMAAYSDNTLTDWAILRAEGFTDIEPVKMSKKRPSGSHYSRGCPRCVWPPVSSDITTQDIDDDSPLWRWKEKSIGGQSGSGIWSDADHLQYGLLTWLWGGYGAGQMTSEIYRQAVNQTVAGHPRIPDLIEVPAPLPPSETSMITDEPEIENGFFAQMGITDLPIWAEDSPPPPNPDEPDDTRKLLVIMLGEMAEFAVKWQKRLMTESEQIGPVAKPGDTFGL